MSADTCALALNIRQHVLRMTSVGKSSHVGSCLSVVDILAVLYGAVLRHDPADPAWPLRDRVVLSKGHAGAAMYATLAECGYFPAERLASHCANGSFLSGHVTHLGVPGVELSTGSLGHGLSVGAGMALRCVRRHASWRVFVVLSDGECDEGSVWEAAMFAGHHRLHPLTAVVDYNKLQSLGSTQETLDLEPFADKWRAFGWDVEEFDGHDHGVLHRALTAVSADGRPRCLVAHTVKGKGVPFMENSVLWHYRPPSAEELEAALVALGTGAA